MDMWTADSRELYGRIQVLETEGRALGREERLAAMVEPLLAWYRRSRRILPWREDPQPYYVWVSEIMLQQTRVEAVKPYFARFMAALPTVMELAAVEEERLLKLWEGLGYYNRAKNLKRAAQTMVEHWGGQVPGSYEELKKLPGIGSYTAGAVASIAFGVPVPAVDGNVLRVVSRVLASREDILKQKVRRQMEQDLLGVIPHGRAGDFNQALIEVGAIVCVPQGAPRCGECPLEGICLARRQGLTDEIPVKAPKARRRIEERTVCVITDGERVLLDKRADKGLLASLYELPNREGYFRPEELKAAFGLGQVLEVRPLPSAKHVFSHIEWHMIGFWVRVPRLPEGRVQACPSELKGKYPLPNAFQEYMKQIM